MAKVITLSQRFPAGHVRVGQNTRFVQRALNALGIDYLSFGYTDLLFFLNDEKIKSKQLSIDDISRFLDGLNADPSYSSKIHTIRGGYRFKDVDQASLRIWSGKPYNSPQIIIAPDCKVITKPVAISICDKFEALLSVSVNGQPLGVGQIMDVAKNDGLSDSDFYSWFHKPAVTGFNGQVICWADQIPY